MALLDEIDPPSQNCGPEQTKILKQQTTKSKNHFYINKLRSFLTQTSFASVFSTPKKLSPVFTKSRLCVRNFVFNSKYLPHFALLCLGAVVAISNINDKVIAAAYYNNIVSTEPSSETAVAQTADHFMPLLPDGSVAVEKAILASASADGFASSTASVATVLTTREEPLPDNSTETVQYVVKNGDTLSMLGMRFDVKLATLKYLNDLDSVDSIKPGMKLKIPPKGYEVSASAIAKKENDKKTKLASAQRNTVARNGTSSRNTVQRVVMINGVRYVRRANANESQCYTYVTSQGYDVGGHGLARFIPTNSRTPRAGGLVVTYESWAGHVAIVTGVNGDGTFNIRESNYTHGWITERTMSVSDRGIKGFVN